MPTNFDDVEFFAKKIGDRWPASMDELVDTWVAFQHAPENSLESKALSWAFDAASDLTDGYPDLAFEFILKVLAKNISNEAFYVLAAGPLEDLLARQGAAVIDRIETQARTDPQFRKLLGGVWQNDMTGDVWQRVQRAAFPT